MNVEVRLREAMHAVGDGVQPDEVSGLAAVRARGRAARRRRAALVGASATLAVVAVGLVVTRPDGDRDSLTLSGEPSMPASATPSSVAPPAAAPQPTIGTSPATTIASTTVPATTTEAPEASVSVFEQVIWPGPDHLPFDDPVAAARSFVEEFIGRDDPPLGEFRPSGTDIGTVDVHYVTDAGAVSPDASSTITVQRVDGHWYVTSVFDDEVRIDSPAPNDLVASPVRVEGRAQGYEGTVVVEVRDAFSGSGDPLGQKVTMGGAYDGALPFSALVPLSARPSASNGVIVASTDSGLPDAGSFAAVPVRFAHVAAGPGESGEVTTLRVFFPRVADGELVEVERTVPETTGVLRASLVAMLDGPTEDERADGLMTWFPQDSGGALEGVNLIDGVATVQLSSRLAEAPPPEPADDAIAQLNATVFQFANVQMVRYELDRTCEAFDAWLNQGCEFTP